jgi:Na+-translocating ferredoxin:NAD+ oxidoreductase RnfD subunit
MSMTAQPRRVLGSIQPKHLIAAFITLILGLGEVGYGIAGGFDKLALTLGTCIATEIGLSLFLLRRFPSLISAYVTGLSLTMLVRPDDAVLWPFVVGPVLSVGSKYVLRYGPKHLWNPSNLGISVLLLLAPARVAILSHEMSNDLRVNAAIWAVGLIVVLLARVYYVTLSYAAAFVARAFVQSLILDLPFWTVVAPLTGPMYQLLVFFMLTDPPTSRSTVRGRIATVLIIALVEFGIRLANGLHLPGAEVLAAAPPIFALFLVGPVALWLELRRRPAAQPTPVSVPGG